MMRLAVVALLWVVASGAALAQFLPVERLEVPSTIFSDQEFLRGDAAAGKPVRLIAGLQLPERDGPQPVVILLHGSDGPQSVAVNSWVERLSGMGYAVLRIDSFGRRGVNQISTDQPAVSQFSQIFDSYRAVELLASDPRVDASAIVLMGFSRGGQATLYASLARFHALYGPSTGAIAGYLPFYPGCNFELLDGTELVDAPVRAFHGAADDWTSPVVCKAYVDTLKAAGADIEMTLYEGARHAFDAPLARFPFTNHAAQRSFDCMRVEDANGVLLNRDTGKPFSYADACVTLGPTVQFDEAATAAAIAAVGAFLAETVGAP